LKKKWGVIEGISDKEFVTNSFHVPVWEKPLIFEKIDFEKPYAELCNGGTITYVEVDGNIQNNLPALEKIVDYAMDKGIPYFAVNLPIDRCRSCGYDSEILGDNCPECGSTDIERLRRITGYLTSSTEYWNKGKRDEESRRVKHNQQNKIFK
jgi:ribonucleoside-triphosphate reductase